MSTPARYAQAVVQPPSAVTATSTALVPIASDRGPRLAPPEKPVNAHRLFYGVGYAGLVMIWAGVWLGGLVGPHFEFLFIFGGLMVALGGFGILIHTVWKPNERKVRHLLLAIASLAVTIAAIPLVQRISREMYATAAVDRLQPLADALAKDARIQDIGVHNGNAMLNGYYGPEQGPGGSIDGRTGEYLLSDVLTRDGISPKEYQAYQRGLQRAGMERAGRSSYTVIFSPAGPREPRLLYVVSGHPLPATHALRDDAGTYYSEPLGGPWHMLLRGRR